MIDQKRPNVAVFRIQFFCFEIEFLIESLNYFLCSKTHLFAESYLDLDKIKIFRDS
jgi:hypothetical protein